ncbi:MAG: hypothetical protein KDG56_20090, partial [Ottowia sp.]|nr:hypothetical protein [Ottowia sp.]
RANRHRRVEEQHRILARKLRGHDAYYGITHNGESLAKLRHEVKRAWRFWLNRRSQRAPMTWKRFVLLLERYPLPAARVVHSAFRAAKP